MKIFFTWYSGNIVYRKSMYVWYYLNFVWMRSIHPKITCSYIITWLKQYLLKKVVIIRIIAKSIYHAIQKLAFRNLHKELCHILAKGKGSKRTWSLVLTLDYISFLNIFINSESLWIYFQRSLLSINFFFSVLFFYW